MSLPKVERLSASQRAIAAISIAVAIVVFIVNVFTVATHVAMSWWTPFALVAGMAAADFLSGMVHWGADTWGRDDLPFVGRRLLVPFRIHHVNPDDFLERPFLDTNGEVALLSIPVLLGARLLPLEAAWGEVLAVAAIGLCGVGMMTNQIHQWAHMRRAPGGVRLLQRIGLILGNRPHECHHRQPYDGSYCIATGWCNAVLDRCRFFRRLERVITICTGAVPRGDDARYERFLTT